MNKRTSKMRASQTKKIHIFQVKEGKMRILIRNRESIGCGSLVMKLNEKHSSYTELICMRMGRNGLFFFFLSFFEGVCAIHLFELPLSQHALNVCTVYTTYIYQMLSVLMFCTDK